MVSVSARDFEKALGSGAKLPRILVLHGDNDDLKADLFKRTCGAVDVSPEDPFRFVRLEQHNLDLETGRLADELGAISMFGGSRLVHVRATARQCEQVINQALDVPGDWLLLAEAPDLDEADWLSKVARRADVALVACVPESAGDFHAFVEREIATAGLVADQDAVERLISLVGEDRAAVRAELVKLGALAGYRRTIEVGDVNAAVADASSMLADEIAAAAISGECETLSNSLERLAITGADAVQALMAAHRLALTMHRSKAKQWANARQEKHAPAWTAAQLRYLVRLLGQSVRQTRNDSANANLIAERSLAALGYAAMNRRR